jgi:hypothetical protein
MAGSQRKHWPDIVPGKQWNIKDCRARIKPSNQGVYACESLSFGLNGKGLGEMPLLPTGLGKSDCPGVCPAKAGMFSRR